MEIYVIDPFQVIEPHFPIIGIVPSYYSYVWNVQLYDIGYFELTVAASKENVKLLKKGRFLLRQADILTFATLTIYQNAMIIRSVDIVYDADQGYLLKVSGKMIKDILSQRIVFDQYEADDLPLPTVIWQLLQLNMINTTVNPLENITVYEDIIENKEEELQNLYSELTALMEVWEQAIIDYGEDSPEAKAAKENVDSCQAIIDTTQAEKDDAEAKKQYWEWDFGIQEYRVIPYVSAGIVDIPNPPRITCQLRGENLGEWVASTCSEEHFGWDMVLSNNAIAYNMAVGSDKRDTVIFSPEFDNLLTSEYVDSLETYKNAALIAGEGDGLDQKVANVGTSSGFSRYETFLSASELTTNDGTISDSKYVKMLQQFGKTELAKLKKRSTFSGDIDPNGAYKIGEDVVIGDIVTIANDQGITAAARLIEIIYSDDESGSIVTGTFEEMEV